MVRSSLILLLFSISTLTHAHEGMWIPTLLNSLNAGHLEASGLKLSPEDIYSINQSSLKDAIVHFGGGCTAEVISDQGLILTNYHCGYGQVQSHSTVEQDYLSEGFWAETKKDELQNGGLTATFIDRIEDVTALVLAGVNESMSENERNKIILENSQRLETERSVDGLEAAVRAFFYGNDYYIIITKTYKDVRLVGAPPASIGKFGGDTDNWVWPRHTGDFALFRIYADADNEPAEYAESNVPYSPQRHLKISLDGADDGDFVMVYGFPGRTEQYLISESVDRIVNRSNPMKIHMRETSLGIIDQAMLDDDKVRIQYAAKQARISNAYKKWIGQNFGLKYVKAIDKKRELESEFNEWLRSDKEAMQTYGQILSELTAAEKDAEMYQAARELFIEYVYYGPEFYRLVSRFDRLARDYEQLSTAGELDKTIENLTKGVKAHFKDYDMQVDLAVFKALTPLYLDYLDPRLYPEFFKHTYTSKYGSSANSLGNKLYGSSIFMNEEKLLDWLSDVDEKAIAKLEKDLAVQLTHDVFDSYYEQVRPNLATRMNRIDKLMRSYVTGLEDMMPEKQFWPDANSTLRLTYGKVEGSRPKDGVEYLSHTTMDGVIAKYIPGHRDFDLPQRLIDLHEEKDYGQYADEDGKLYVCFTGSNHTSGGNSGSPALDAEGNLIGLNFDRSWESTMSDIMFSPQLCRNIMVDIRYVLFIIDKYAGAGHLVEEMDLIKSNELGRN